MPVFQNATRDLAYLPFISGQTASGRHVAANFIDNAFMLFLPVVGDGLCHPVQLQAGLTMVLAYFSGLRAYGDETGLAPVWQNPLGWLPVFIKIPVLPWLIVWRIENGRDEKES